MKLLARPWLHAENQIKLDMDEDELRAYRKRRASSTRSFVWVILVGMALTVALLVLSLFVHCRQQGYAVAGTGTVGTVGTVGTGKGTRNETGTGEGTSTGTDRSAFTDTPTPTSTSTDTDTSTSASTDTPPVILVSIDGFRYEYLSRGLTPNLKRLTEQGIYGPMEAQFPSYTFPNHYTLVTGLYPEAHGIVANSFYDPDMKEYFSYTDQQNLRQAKWWKAEPIWNTIQRHGLKSATMFWPGSESAIDGHRPNLYVPYDSRLSTAQRIAQVLRWLDRPAPDRPHFISLYLSLVDDVGHVHGPESAELDAALAHVDAGIGALMAGLQGRAAHVVVVSDHGMAQVRADGHVYLDELVPGMREQLAWVDFGPVASLLPVDAASARAVHAALKAHEPGRHYRVYWREEIPERFHFRASRRIAPLVVVCEPGWVLDYRGGAWVPRGVHGYDPRAPDMQALFIATGPGLRQVGRGRGPLRGLTNLDVYPFMMRLLHVPALPNNGTLRLVELCRRED